MEVSGLTATSLKSSVNSHSHAKSLGAARFVKRFPFLCYNGGPAHARLEQENLIYLFQYFTVRFRALAVCKKKTNNLLKIAI